jgi:ABC-type cobalt transport system substrate-binding protein
MGCLLRSRRGAIGGTLIQYIMHNKAAQNQAQ